MPLAEGGSWQLGGFCTMTGSQGGPSVTEHGWALTSSSSLCLLRCAVVLSSQGGAMADSGSPPPQGQVQPSELQLGAAIPSVVFPRASSRPTAALCGSARDVIMGTD